MNLFRKPVNRWGWLRAAGGAALIGVLAWTLLSALLRSAGEVTWITWSGYQAFSFGRGLELAMAPLLAVLVGGWLEEHEHRVETEQSRHREVEQSAATRRKEALQRLHAAVLVELPGAAQLSPQASQRIQEAVKAAVAELDGKGKGEALHILYEKGLVRGDHPAVSLDGAEASGTEASGADFSGALVHKAHFENICLEKVDLQKARLDNAHLANSRLSGSNLNRAHLRHADLRGARLVGCNLAGARLDGANLEGADLTGCRFDGAVFINANLKDCILTGEGGGEAALDLVILVDSILPDGRKMTNEKGKEYLRNKEVAVLVDRL